MVPVAATVAPATVLLSVPVYVGTAVVPLPVTLAASFSVVLSDAV